MSSATTNFKLGLFTILALASMLAAAFGLGIWTMRGDHIRYHTYLDESVEGLEIGAPVKYRGVLIGTVEHVGVAPDRKLVDVTLSIDTKASRKLELEASAPDLRTQLGTQGITGVKFINIDFFDPKTTPPPPLSFKPAEHYIPAAPSLLKGLQDSLSGVLERLPALVEATTLTVQKVNAAVDDYNGERVPARLGKVIDNVDAAVADMRTLVKNVDRAKIPEKTAAGLEQLDAALEHANAILARIDGDGGLVASTQRATDSIGDLGRKTSNSTEDLDRTLRDLDEAAIAIRDLAQAIERDPDMLVKGRATGKKP
jgi:paraquat-inducible protein B